MGLLLVHLSDPRAQLTHTSMYMTLPWGSKPATREQVKLGTAMSSSSGAIRKLELASGRVGFPEKESVPVTSACYYSHEHKSHITNRIESSPLLRSTITLSSVKPRAWLYPRVSLTHLGL
jgi:hypothetical protein